MTEPFAGSRFKIERGRRHITELESEIAAYLSREPWALLLERNLKTGEYAIAARGRESVPPNLSLVFGDAVHNFRVALDLMANDAVALCGVRPKKVYFPFAESREGLEDQIKQKMRGASATLIEMVRALQPYRGGNELLRALHDLDIADKHIAAITADASISSGALPMRQLPGATPTRMSFVADFAALPTVPVDLAGFVLDPAFAVIGKVAGSASRLTIANGLPLGGHPVIAAIRELAQLVESIVQAFAEHCFRRD